MLLKRYTVSGILSLIEKTRTRGKVKNCVRCVWVGLLASVFFVFTMVYPVESADYIAYQATGIVIDGTPDEFAWDDVSKSPLFSDIETGEAAWLESRSAVLWNEQYLFIAFWLEEPDVRAFLRNRDDKIYLDNDVEVFIDGDDCYYELELNAFGTLYEVFWIWDDVIEMSRFWSPEFDSTVQRVMKLNGIGDHKHPRGMRTGFLDWDMPGIQWSVNVNGTINNSSDTDVGWTVEIAIPWQALTPLAGKRSLPPRDGDIWRIDCSRFQQYGIDGRKLERPAGWVWKMHKAFDSHMPEMFPRILFSTEVVGEIAR